MISDYDKRSFFNILTESKVGSVTETSYFYREIGGIINELPSFVRRSFVESQDPDPGLTKSLDPDPGKKRTTQIKTINNVNISAMAFFCKSHHRIHKLTS